MNCPECGALLVEDDDGVCCPYCGDVAWGEE
jgi:uncharacterized Zn finger protein (UPF0148 family)